MIDPLTESEGFCKKSLEVLVTPCYTQTREIVIFQTKIKDLMIRISESKKKIMVRSPEGRSLSVEVLNKSNKLFEVITEFHKSALDDKNMSKVSESINSFESSIEKLEIYWKSFEYVTT